MEEDRRNKFRLNSGREHKTETFEFLFFYIAQVEKY